MKPGPKRGYKQAPEHVEKRKRFGADHHAWKGDDVSEKGGRTRALRSFDAQPCESCGAEKTDRHHKDGNTANNAPENIVFLCRRCHMEADGRLDDVREQARRNQPAAVAARWR